MAGGLDVGAGFKVTFGVEERATHKKVTKQAAESLTGTHQQQCRLTDACVSSQQLYRPDYSRVFPVYTLTRKGFKGCLHLVVNNMDPMTRVLS